MNEKWRSNGQEETGETLPPYSLDAEKGLLAAILNNPSGIHDAMSVVGPDDFYLEKHKAIFKAMKSVVDKGMDVEPFVVAEEMKEMGFKDPQQESQDGITKHTDFLLGLLSDYATAYFPEQFASYVQTLSIRRRLLVACSKIARLAYDESGEIREQLAEAEDAIFSVRGVKLTKYTEMPEEYAGAAIDRFREAMAQEGQQMGLPSGLLDLDRLLGGFIEPHCYIVAGRPSMGKSSFMCAIARHLIIEEDLAVAFFSPEMSSRQLTNRIASSMVNVPVTKIRFGTTSDAEAGKVLNAMGQISQSRLVIDTTPEVRPSEIKAVCKRIYGRIGLDLIIIDHLNLMKPDRNLGSTYEEMSEISAKVAALGKEFGVPVIAAAQLNRQVENRQDKRPQLADLRDSGKIEENAYAVLFLYRDEYYNELTETPNVAEIEVAKHRDGPTGKVDVYWNGELATFRNLKRHTLDLNGKEPTQAALSGEHYG